MTSLIMIVYGPDASDESYPQVKKIHGLLENPSLYFFFHQNLQLKASSIAMLTYQ
jgi:hypothetical protein